MSSYHLIRVTTQGYRLVNSFAATPDEAARLHVAAWRKVRGGDTALVMREAETGHRISVRESEDALGLTFSQRWSA